MFDFTSSASGFSLKYSILGLVFSLFLSMIQCNREKFKVEYYKAENELLLTQTEQVVNKFITIRDTITKVEEAIPDTIIIYKKKVVYKTKYDTILLTSQESSKLKVLGLEIKPGAKLFHKESTITRDTQIKSQADSIERVTIDTTKLKARKDSI